MKRTQTLEGSLRRWHISCHWLKAVSLPQNAVTAGLQCLRDFCGAVSFKNLHSTHPASQMGTVTSRGEKKEAAVKVSIALFHLNTNHFKDNL